MGYEHRSGVFGTEQEAIDHLLTMVPIIFYDMNCYDIRGNECSGWDGVSRRCECGNRRVHIVTENYRKDDDSESGEYDESDDEYEEKLGEWVAYAIAS
jgi:hypothetical protein